MPRGSRSGFVILVLLAVSNLLTAISVYAEAAGASDAYRTAESIRSLSLEQSTLSSPAQLRGVVTQSTDDGLVIQDASAGIWVYWNASSDFSAGDEVEVDGVVDPGLFAPSIRGYSVHKLGRAPLPKPREVTLRELNAGEQDCQYVSVAGTVLSAGLRTGASQKQKLWLRIAVANGFVNATFPAEDAPAAAKLVDAVVRINAAAMATKNDSRQITAATLSVAGMGNVTVLRPPPADLFAQPLSPIGRLMQYRSGTDYNHRVRVAGTVTYYRPGESIVLEDNGKALFVATTQSGNIQLGDRVEAVGFPASHSAGPILRDAVLRRIAAGQPLQPTPVRLADICSGALNYNLVRTEGQVLRRVREPSREVLLLQDDADSVLVELAQSGASGTLQALQEGSVVQVSAISILEVDGTWNYGVSSASSIHCKLLLRSPGDVLVLRPPSWWTTRHVLYIAAILGALVLAFLCLVVYIRVEHWRLQAVHEERERLAHEIHDTLAQSFSGIGFQLQAIRKAIPQESPGLRKQVDLACDLVRHSHKEARRSIEPLRLDPLRLDPREKVDLLSSLESSARKMVEGGSVEVETTRSGSPRPISPLITDTLLRIGQESIANAVRHADPSRLQITLHWEQDSVRLAVRDNGIGFVKSGGLLGFGLRGMRKRAADIGARLEIFSQPRAGTRVEVTAHIPPSKGVAALFKYFLERVSHVEAKP
jgi:signal transduction histidine kinase